MPIVEKTFAVALTIPDNEAFTARETLRRLGVPVAHVRRATIWTFHVDAGAADELGARIAELETICNPNKHELTERPSGRPAAGEVWIATCDEAPLTRIGGRAIAGVRQIDRKVAWQLIDESGSLGDAALLDRAVETFLCNPAFQKAIR